MRVQIQILAAALALVSTSVLAQPSGLRQKVAILAVAAKGKVSVACSLPGTTLDCDLNPTAKPPMQSVFKLPLALTALHLVEQKKLFLDQPIRFRREDRIPHAYSPLQDKYPEAEVDVPLHELLSMAVSLSDNAAADIVLRVVGGPSAENQYVQSLGISGFHIQDNEAGLHRDVTAQYRNWFQPKAAVQLLRRLVDNPPLTREHMDLVLSWMRDTPRGVNRIKGELPAGTVVMHKPGTSGADNGIAPATNDIGLVLLPDGRYLAIAVFVTDSSADEATRDASIAKIAKAAYETATQPTVAAAR
jgi:beta-lactamase class A